MKELLKFPLQQDFEVKALTGNSHFSFSKIKKDSAEKARPQDMLFGYVYSGTAVLSNSGAADLKISEGMYFAVNADWQVKSNGGVLAMKAHDYSGLTMFGGPIEATGRLQYIDNCTDSLLLSPTRLGDPCLNLLVFPPGVRQTAHTHPSFRAGIVVSGSGTCETEGKSAPLLKNDFFLIPENTRHCFFSGNEGLRVIAFHPDSDYGPTDQIHPMINRTVLGKP